MSAARDRPPGSQPPRLRALPSRIRFVKEVTGIKLREVLGPAVLTVISNFATLASMAMILGLARAITTNGPLPGWVNGIVEHLPESLQGRPLALAVFTCGIVGFRVVAAGTGFIARVQTERVAGAVQVRSSKIIFEKVVTQKMEFFDNQLIGEVSTTLVRASSTMSGFVSLAQNSLMGLLMAVSTLLLMLSLSPLMTGISVVFLAFMLFVTARSKLYLERLNASIRKEEVSLGTSVNEVLGHPELVKSNASETYEIDRYAKRVELFNKLAQRKAVRKALPGTVKELVEMASIIFTAGTIGLLKYFSPDSIAAGNVFGFLYLARTLTVRADGIVSSFVELSSRLDEIGEIQGLFSELEVESDASDAHKQPISSLDHAIEAIKLDFSYAQGNGPPRDDPRVLRDVTLTIAAGATTVILGESGSGKSTLAKLLLRFYPARDGTLTYNGLDIALFKRRDWRQRIAYVPQHSLVLPGTIRENLLYGSLERTPSPAELEAVVAAANLTTLVARLPLGLDTPIRGNKLSGGEKQRIAIGRALLRNADLYVFDEASSAIDPQTEQLILKRIQELLAGRSIVFITHRPAAIKYATTCYYFENGSCKLVKHGDFADHDALAHYLENA